MKVSDIKKGDLVYYRNHKMNIVHRPYEYKRWYNENFCNISLSNDFDIMLIKRYKKIFCFYILKTIYKRGKN